MMTALVACLGLLPAALSTGIGSDTQKPFAIVIVAGLISRLFLAVFRRTRCFTAPSPATATSCRCDVPKDVPEQRIAIDTLTHRRWFKRRPPRRTRGYRARLPSRRHKRRCSNLAPARRRLLRKNLPGLPFCSPSRRRAARASAIAAPQTGLPRNAAKFRLELRWPSGLFNLSSRSSSLSFAVLSQLNQASSLLRGN